LQHYRPKKFAAHARSSCGPATVGLSLSLYPEHRPCLQELCSRHKLGASRIFQVLLEAERSRGLLTRIIGSRLRTRECARERI